MRFNLFALTTALLTAGSVHGAPEMSKRTSPTDVTGTLAELTSTVGDVNAVVTQINALSAVFVTPIAIEALGGLISEIGLASVSLNLAGGSLPLPSATDQTAICTSLGTFLTAFTSLITTLTLQAATLKSEELGPLVNPTLETALTVVQSFVSGTVTTVPVCGAAYTLQLGTVSTVVSTLVTALS